MIDHNIAQQQKIITTYDSQQVYRTDSRECSRDRNKSIENCMKQAPHDNETLNSELKSFEDKIKQIEKLDVGMDAKNQQFQRIVEEYKYKFTQQDPSNQQSKLKYMNIVNNDNNEDSNTRSDGNNEEIDVENYINKNLEK